MIEVRCAHRDQWVPNAGTLVGTVDGGVVTRRRERVEQADGRVTLDERTSRLPLKGHTTVYCPQCGRGYLIARQRGVGASWQPVGGIWVSPASLRRRESTIWT